MNNERVFKKITIRDARKKVQAKLLHAHKELTVCGNRTVLSSVKETLIMLSKTVLERIGGEILGVLYENYPLSLFTKQVADRIERDNELVKRLLEKFEEKNLVEKARRKKEYVRRKRWKMTPSAKERYDSIYRETK